MTERRSQKLGRLVRVQRQIERMAQADLAQTLRQRAATDLSLDQLVDALGSLDPVHRAMSAHYAAQLSTLLARLQHLEKLQQRQENMALREKLKADRLTLTASDARRSEIRQDQVESLLDLLEKSLPSGRSDSSLR